MITARFDAQKNETAWITTQPVEPTAKDAIDIPYSEDFNYVPYRVGKTGRDVRGTYR